MSRKDMHMNRTITVSQPSGKVIIEFTNKVVTLEQAITIGEWATNELKHQHGTLVFTVRNVDEGTVEHNSTPVWTPTYDDRFGMVSETV